MMEHINAPFTEAQVAALNRWQQEGCYHPFTCANRSDGQHQYRDGDVGTLVATVDGFLCPDCDYRQSWAWDVMARQ